MILIVGATGVLGREVARQLLAGGHQVRALVRNPEKARDLQEQGAEVVQGNLTDPASLARACQNVDAVFTAVHAVLGRGNNTSERVDDLGHRSVIDAAKRARVKHFVYTSIIKAGPDHPIDLYRTKYKIEEYLKASGLSYTILRPAAFMEQHVHEFLGKSILLTGKTFVLGRGNNPTNFVAGHDVARVAVLALTDPRAKNKTITVGGLENMTRNQVAELYGRVSGRIPKVRHVPPAMLQVMSKVLKPIHPGLSRFMRFCLVVDQSDETFDPTGFLQEYPITLTRLEEFVRQRAAEVEQSKGLQKQVTQ
jgi:uncharacterized protein YbjT (DUF2867 family)